MLTQRENIQMKLHAIMLEDIVPKDHFLRKLDAAVDFSFIYDEVRGLYCENNGRPSVDPVMLVKYLLIGYLYGIDSERRIEQEIQVNMAYRWFLKLDIDERVPDHSTISQNRRRRFDGENLFRKIFERILAKCIKEGLVDGKIVLTDSTHVKASASQKSEYKVLVEKEAEWYMERLDRYEALEREKLEKQGKIKAAALGALPTPRDPSTPGRLLAGDHHGLSRSFAGEFARAYLSGRQCIVILDDTVADDLAKAQTKLAKIFQGRLASFFYF